MDFLLLQKINSRHLILLALLPLLLLLHLLGKLSVVVILSLLLERIRINLFSGRILRPILSPGSRCDHIAVSVAVWRPATTLTESTEEVIGRLVFIEFVDIVGALG